jgi:hypothetical protein
LVLVTVSADSINHWTSNDMNWAWLADTNVWVGWEHHRALQEATYERLRMFFAGGDIVSPGGSPFSILCNGLETNIWAVTNPLVRGHSISSEWWQALDHCIVAVATNCTPHNSSPLVGEVITTWTIAAIMDLYVGEEWEDYTNLVRIPARLATNSTVHYGSPQRGDFECREWYYQRYLILTNSTTFWSTYPWWMSNTNWQGGAELLLTDYDGGDEWSGSGSSSTDTNGAASWTEAKTAAQADWSKGAGTASAPFREYSQGKYIVSGAQTSYLADVDAGFCRIESGSIWTHRTASIEWYWVFSNVTLSATNNAFDMGNSPIGASPNEWEQHFSTNTIGVLAAASPWNSGVTSPVPAWCDIPNSNTVNIKGFETLTYSSGDDKCGAAIRFTLDVGKWQDY